MSIPNHKRSISGFATGTINNIIKITKPSLAKPILNTNVKNTNQMSVKLGTSKYKFETSDHSTNNSSKTTSTRNNTVSKSTTLKTNNLKVNNSSRPNTNNPLIKSYNQAKLIKKENLSDNSVQSKSRSQTKSPQHNDRKKLVSSNNSKEFKKENVNKLGRSISPLDKSNRSSVNSQSRSTSKDTKVRNQDFRTMTTSPILLKKKLTLNKTKEAINTTTSSTFNKNLKSNSVSKTPIKTVTNINNIITNKSSLIQSKLNQANSYKKKIRNIHEISQIGYSGPNVKKINQDNVFVYENFTNNPLHIYLGVCDGHGTYGHEISRFVCKHLPANLSKQSKLTNEIIDKVFHFTNKEIYKEYKTISNFSGSTCISVIYTPELLTCINLGDSRAVLGRYIDGIWTSYNLSKDHKPDNKDEASRIKKCGGRIEPYKDENNEFIGPPRVWLKDDNIPGLAMSRSFGDEIASQVGITCIPEIHEWKFTKEDKFLILASDGLWEFIESEECVNIVKDFYIRNEIKEACAYLVNESSKRWIKEEEVIDDITIIALFFE